MRIFVKQQPKLSISLARNIDKPRLDSKSDWHFMVPEGNSGPHGRTVFISRDSHVTGCHTSLNLMEKRASLTWTQKLLQDGKKKYYMNLTFRWPLRECQSINLTSPWPSVSWVIYHLIALWAKARVMRYAQPHYPSILTLLLLFNSWPFLFWWNNLLELQVRDENITRAFGSQNWATCWSLTFIIKHCVGFHIFTL